MKQVEEDPSGRFIRYDVLLGRGSYKDVYKAFDTYEAVEVAWNKLQVGRIPREHISKVEFEVALLKRLDHKNIIKLFSAWSSQSSKHPSQPGMDFVTELMSSGTLKDYLTRSRVMKLKVIRRWCHNLLDAITYLHEQDPPVMHRDLKCDNIFINGHVGEVKIGDLGLSGVKHDVVAQSVIGTPEFMAPELYEESYTEKVDIYAFGMCMLEMITMEYPYSECENPAQIFRKVFSGEKPLSFQRLPHCEIKQVIASCLEREKVRPSARQLLQHPFFSDWASDDGVATNLSIANNTLRPNYMREPHESDKIKTGVDVVRDPQACLQVDQSVVCNSDVMNRDVLIAREKLQNQLSDSQICVSPSSDGTELCIAITIPINGKAEKVEFFFNPEEDVISEITSELVQEFGLHDIDQVELSAKITKQINIQMRTQENEQELDHLYCERDMCEVHGENYVTGAKLQAERTSKAVESGSHMPRETSSNPANSRPVQPLVQKGTYHQASLSPDVRPSNAGSSYCTAIQPYNLVSRHLRFQQVPPTSTERYSTLFDKNFDGLKEDFEECSSSNGSVTMFFDRANFMLNMALMDHCANGKYDIVTQKLREGAKADFADYDRRTPLHLAASEGHVDVAELLISHGADLDAEDRWGSKPIDDARTNKHKDMIQTLLMSGAQPEERSISRSDFLAKAMMQYAANGFDEMVREMLMAGADATFIDKEKRTPLHLACAEGHFIVAQLLLLNGADPVMEDDFGLTAMDEAVKNGHVAMIDLLRRFGGAMPTQLMSKEDVEYQYGMDLVTQASRGYVKKVQYLLGRGTNVNYADYDKRTALHLASAEGHADTTKVLIEAGADVYFKDRWNVSPLDEAQKNNHINIVNMIVAAERQKQQNGNLIHEENITGEVVDVVDDVVLSTDKTDEDEEPLRKEKIDTDQTFFPGDGI